MCMSECMYDKTKTPDWNALKFGTLVVFDNQSKPLGSKGAQDQGHRSSYITFGILFISVKGMQLQSPDFYAQVHYGQLLPAHQKLCRNAPPIT